MPGLDLEPTVYHINDYWRDPSPALIAAARRGELPRCVEVRLHRNAKGRWVTFANADLNEVVLGMGFWVRSEPNNY